MGGHGSGRISNTAKIMNQMRGPQPEPRTPIATEMFLPNHSGDHSAGIVNTTPVNDTDLVNKKYVDDMVKDYNLEVIEGNVEGHSMVSINGHNDTATTTRVTVSPQLTTADIDQSVIHATPATVKVASTSDADNGSTTTGLLTLLLVGLDTAGAAQSETITLDGQTEITSTKTYSAIQGFRGLTWGSGNTSAGHIYVGSGTFVSGVPAVIMFSAEAAHNKGLTSYYTVPAGHHVVPRNFIITLVGSNKSAAVHVETSSDGKKWIVEGSFGVLSGGIFTTEVKGLPHIDSGHIRLTCLAGGMDTEVTAILVVELIKDGF